MELGEYVEGNLGAVTEKHENVRAKCSKIVGKSSILNIVFSLPIFQEIHISIWISKRTQHSGSCLFVTIGADF